MKNMKACLMIVLVLFISSKLFAQTSYETSKDAEDTTVKVLKGIITKYIIESDTSFTWYIPNQTMYTPDSAIVNTFKREKDSVEFILFGGTWCDDTQFILPKFFKLQEESGIADSAITFFAVDTKKKTSGNIADAFHITNVPTIIIMKNGKELGRVIEYGKTGKWDKELADILNGN